MVATMKPLHPAIKKVLDEKGDDWVVAAIVDGSIGYSDPKHAKILIKHYKEGERRDFCERCYALYDGNLEKMILDDISKFEYAQETSPDRAKRVIEFVKVWDEKAGNSDPLNSVGLAYPTIMI